MDFREKYIPKTWFVVLLYGQEKEVRVGIFSVCPSQPIRREGGQESVSCFSLPVIALLSGQAPELAASSWMRS